MNLSPEARTILVTMKGQLTQGWIQGRLRNEEGVCLYGALVAAAGLRPLPGACPGAGQKVQGRSGGSGIHFTFPLNSPIGEAVLALSGTAGINWDKLALWNDSPGRTLTEVIDLIDQTIESDARIESDTRLVSRV